MLSSLPKLADRTFILGAFLPTLLFAIALLFEFRDQPLARELLTGLTEKDLGQAAFLLVAVWAVAVVMLMLNRPIYRLLEGYQFPRWLAKWLTSRKRRRLEGSFTEIRVLHDKWAKQGSAFTTTAEFDRYQTLRREAVKWMPSRQSDVLPTRFGNAIRAFEVYPRDNYGADAIVIWPRLICVMPKAFSEQIRDARSQIDFLINCCFFSTVVAALGIARAIYSANWHNLDLHSLGGTLAFIFSVETLWLLWAAGGVIATYLFYRWAWAGVLEWGDLVKSAFDCYLPALAGQLGFELPTTEAERRDFWTSFSQQLIYGRGLDGNAPFHIEKWKQAPSKVTTEQNTKGQSEANEGKQSEANEGED
jgi:hypothetical protein